MSGLTFQCFSPNGTGLYVDESSVGTLTVKNPHNYDDNNLPNELPGIILTLQLMHWSFIGYVKRFG